MDNKTFDVCAYFKHLQKNPKDFSFYELFDICNITAIQLHLSGYKLSDFENVDNTEKYIFKNFKDMICYMLLDDNLLNISFFEPQKLIKFIKYKHDAIYSIIDGLCTVSRYVSSLYEIPDKTINVNSIYKNLLTYNWTAKDYEILSIDKYFFTNFLKFDEILFFEKFYKELKTKINEKEFNEFDIYFKKIGLIK